MRSSIRRILQLQAIIVTSAVAFSSVAEAAPSAPGNVGGRSFFIGNMIDFGNGLLNRGAGSECVRATWTPAVGTAAAPVAQYEIHIYTPRATTATRGDTTALVPATRTDYTMCDIADSNVTILVRAIDTTHTPSTFTTGYATGSSQPGFGPALPVCQKSTGTHWESAGAINDFVSVSAAADGTVVAIDSDNRLWRLDAGATNFTAMGGTDWYSASVGNANNVWATNLSGQMYKFMTRTGNTQLLPGTGWSNVSVAADGTVMSVAGHDATLYRWLGTGQNGVYGNTALMGGTGWTRVAAGAVDNIWSINGTQGSNLWRFLTQYGNTIQLPGGKASAVSVGQDGTAWSLGSGGLYHWNTAGAPSSWTPSLVSTSATPLDANGKTSLPDNSGFVDVAVGSIDNIWAVSYWGWIYKWC